MDFLSFAADGKDSVEFRVKEWISAYQEISPQSLGLLTEDTLRWEKQPDVLIT